MISDLAMRSMDRGPMGRFVILRTDKYTKMLRAPPLQAADWVVVSAGSRG